MAVYQKNKPFSWSYSKLKNYAACPFKHYNVDIIKTFKEDDSEILAWGNEVHDKMAKRLGKDKIPLPPTMSQFEEHALAVERFPGRLFVEQKYGIKADFTGCGWFASDVWYRGIADAVVLNGPRAIAFDWKLGKILNDSQQLALMAACLFGHYPELQRIDTIFMWLKDDAKTHEIFYRKDMPSMWANIMPRIQEYKGAVERQEFAPKPGGLCRKWCPVTTCEHHGA